MSILAAWLPAALVWLALMDLGALLAALGLYVLGMRRMRRLRDVPIPPWDAWPSVSLIAPARNEERHIERAVRSLLARDYTRLEITLVNDRSNQPTGAILDRLASEFPQLNVVHLTELPPGWLGKNHALALGAERSHGEWLLFADADVVFDPTALRRAIAYAATERLDHLAAWPEVTTPSWFLRAFLLTFSVYFFLYVRVWAIRNPRSTAHIGIGAFNLVRTSVYCAVGGHQTIHMRPDDDLKLGKIIKLAGYRQDVVRGNDMLSLEMYASVGELIRGLEKNAFSAIDYNVPLLAGSSLVALVLNVWPFLAVWIVPGPARWLYLASCLALWTLALLGAIGMKVPKSCALGFPLGALLFFYIQWRTMLLNHYQGGIRWRDTHYPLADLKANKV
jgi:glycosyltransferase involved in cell wall biosynthesis